MNSKIKAIIFISAIILIDIIYFFMDLNGVPSNFRIPILNINTTILAVVISTSAAIIIFIISYFAIDEKSVKRVKNARKAGEIYIVNTYNKCLEILELISNEDMLRNYIVPKIDFNKSNLDNKAFVDLVNLPFDTFDEIKQLFISGYYTKNEIENYLNIKKEFHNVVSDRITFFDIKNNIETEEQRALYVYLVKKRDALINQLNDGVDYYNNDK